MFVAQDLRVESGLFIENGFHEQRVIAVIALMPVWNWYLADQHLSRPRMNTWKASVEQRGARDGL